MSRDEHRLLYGTLWNRYLRDCVKVRRDRCDEGLVDLTKTIARGIGRRIKR